MRYRRFSYRYAVVITGQQPGLFGDPWQPARLVLAQPSWRPPADVTETRDAFQATIELAGVEPEALDILVYEDAVVLEGQRRLPPSGGRYLSAEIRQGPFRLELPLSAPVDPDAVEANYERGLLVMKLPKAGTR